MSKTFSERRWFFLCDKIYDYKMITKELKNDEEFLNIIKEFIKKHEINISEDPLKDVLMNVDNNKYIKFDNYVVKCKVKELLTQLRISQKWLAEKTSIPVSSLNGILNDTMPISLNYAYRICKVMGLTMEQAFDFEDKTE